MSDRELYQIMRKAIADSQPRPVPVIIRADGRATHAMVRKAMDTCTEAGIMQISIAAFKEKGESFLTERGRTWRAKEESRNGMPVS